MIVEIIRLDSLPRNGITGKIRINKSSLFDSMEQYSRMNKPFISSIPAGSYLCKRKKSPKFGNTFEITGVEGRTHILFHWGNTADKTGGCVMIGNGIGTINKRKAILNSKKSFDKFMKILKDVDEFPLIISDNY